MALPWWRWRWWAFGVCSVLISGAGAQGRINFNPGDEETRAVPGDLRDDRKPALYTWDYGDCMEDSAIKITRFDAAYYSDNMTISFNINGYTTLVNESLMIHLSVAAYGESRFDLVFNPCRTNIPSLCPVTASVNITATHAVPVSENEVSGIPAIAFTIPDFEGRADLRIFSNSTKSQTACVTALITNGNSFSHPKIISPALGVLAASVGLASFITAMSGGDSIVSSRKLYAHTLSAHTLFSCFHSVYLTGTLSVNFPSVLLAFWSNFAWSAGIIGLDSMQRSLNRFTGGSKLVDGSLAPDRASFEMASDLYPLAKRYVRFGEHQKAGLPKPGNLTGFPATLAMNQVIVRNAFITSFLWALILLVAVAISIIGLKLAINVSIRVGIIKENRLLIFRESWWDFLESTLCKVFLTAVFPLVSLATFQFTLHEPGPSAIGAFVFILLTVGLSAAALAAYRARWRGGRVRVNRTNLVIYPQVRAGFIPWMVVSCRSSIDGTKRRIIMPWWELTIEVDGERGSVHENLKFIRQFGWLASRFRRRSWWAFGPLLFFEILRGILHGGGSGNSKAQVYGLLIVETIYFIVLAYMMPFESTRLNVFAAYMLPTMRVSTLAILCVVLATPELNRIIVTVLGIVVIVIQGATVAVVIAFSLINLYATYLKIAPRGTQIRPESMNPTREKYLNHIEKRALDLPTVHSTQQQLSATGPAPSSFSVNYIRRCPKIDDECDGPARSVFSRNSYMGSAAWERGEDEPVSRVGSPNYPLARLQRPVWPADSPGFANASEAVSTSPSNANSDMDPHFSRDSAAQPKDASSTHTTTTREHESSTKTL
ncbi:TRP-domain-containing protein [Tuber magnatum]|uniref:TRP-domain-containing protein n=1 Tax=Tuber magnatum TaxID=42249 RepID=A0A317SX36_9PEZI|nr:TRP-domain-containing protein [Tuber magnatum]PWW78410.1 TRP-domain-containing protein [Tuber magnatum]